MATSVSQSGRMGRFLLVALMAITCPAAFAEAPEFSPGTVLAKVISPASFVSMTLAPDGKHLASIGYNGLASAVFLIDADTLESTIIVQPKSPRYSEWIPQREPIAVHWIDNDLLAVDFNYGPSESVDLQGQRVASLGERFIRNVRTKGSVPGWVLAYRDLRDGEIQLAHARTGEKKKHDISLSGRLIGGAFDADGVLRAATMMDTAFWSDKTKIKNWYRADERADWQLMEESSLTGGHWMPLAMGDQPGTLIVRSRHKRDTWAIFLYDTQKREHVELMAGHARQDVVGLTGLHKPSFDSVHTEGMKPAVHWFEPRLRALQSAVDAALPGRINLLSDESPSRLLIMSYADVDPGRWLLLDTDAMKMREVMHVRPSINPRTMRPMETIEYAAADGLVIPAYLTRPAGTDAPAPLVVLIHGGPQVRDRWAWNEEVQILAAHGYAVLQPQFRGSTGFGEQFEKAGYGQWGLAMQDDITAGVQHLIARKIVDPGRICIYGSSYGGYAALWGVIKTPELYKCGISFAGVSDIEYALEDWSDRNRDARSREIQRIAIGDLSQNKQQFDQVSPLKNAARIRVPLLIAHGSADVRVPMSHSWKLIGALKENDKAHEWLPFEGEGHGLRLTRNKFRYYTAVLNFLERHIGATASGRGP